MKEITLRYVIFQDHYCVIWKENSTRTIRICFDFGKKYNLTELFLLNFCDSCHIVRLKTKKITSKFKLGADGSKEMEGLYSFLLDINHIFQKLNISKFDQRILTKQLFLFKNSKVDWPVKLKPECDWKVTVYLELCFTIRKTKKNYYSKH